MRMRRIGTALVVTVLAAGVVAAVEQPATAEVRYIHDKAHDGDDNGDGTHSVGDLKRVRIGHGKDWLYVRATPHKGAFLGDFDDYWIDTVQRDPGPELVVETNTDYGDHYWVRRTERFGSYGKVVCEGRVFYDHRTQEYRFRVARDCLRSRTGALPHRLRVSAHTVTVFGTATTGDWAPGKKRFGPWVGVA
jgi:hypothetical protein